MTKPINCNNWARRRRFMLVTTAFCMACPVWVLYTGLDTKPAETAVTMSFVTITGIVGSYVFGAVWDDKNTRSGGQ